MLPVGCLSACLRQRLFPLLPHALRVQGGCKGEAGCVREQGAAQGLRRGVRGARMPSARTMGWPPWSSCDVTVGAGLGRSWQGRAGRVREAEVKSANGGWWACCSASRQLRGTGHEAQGAVYVQAAACRAM